MALVLGIDASTTAVKALVVDEHGGILSEGREALTLLNPAPDGWEQDASTWLPALSAAVRAAVMALLPADRERIAALSIAHQRETFVACDDSIEPLAPALVWMDARCRREVREVVAELDADRIHRLSGKVPCTTPSLYKIRYLLGRARPDLAETAGIFDVHAFLVAKLTGETTTSLASADPLGLVDLEARAYAGELVSLSKARRDRLPRLVSPGTSIGKVKGEIARSMGLTEDVRVIAGAGDGQAAGLGAGVVEPGVAYMNLGTALVTGVISKEYRVDRAFRTLYAATPGDFFFESDLKGGTFTLDWLAGRIVGKDASTQAKNALIAQLEHEATSIPAGSGGLVFMPYLLGVMNPFWDDDASAAAIGLRGDHRPAHLFRAAVEGLAFEARLALDHIERASQPITEVRVMGGATRSDLVMGIFADVLGRPIFRTSTTEATAMGAAFLARAAVEGSSVVDIAVASSPKGERVGGMGNAEVYDRLYTEVYQGLYESLRARMERLTQLTRES